jgi:hypothetical protein
MPKRGTFWGSLLERIWLFCTLVYINLHQRYSEGYYYGKAKRTRQHLSES